MSNLMFFGTPNFAVPSLQILHEFCQNNGHRLLGVVCQADKPAQRGQHLTAPPVKELALKLQLPVWQPMKITPNFIAWFQEQQVDLSVVVAYGKILPQNLLDSSKLGFINVHASLLPRWRGAAPIQRAIQAGDTKTGVCIMNLVAQMDAGEIYQTAETEIKPNETSGELFERLSKLGAETLLQALPGILGKKLPKLAQSPIGITYAHKLHKEEALIDWNKTAAELVNFCRAMQPWPGCHSFYQGKKIKLFGAYELSETNKKGEKGQIIEAGDQLVIATAKGLIAFQEGQLEGKRRMPIPSLLSGFSIHVGEHLG